MLPVVKQAYNANPVPSLRLIHTILCVDPKFDLSSAAVPAVRVRPVHEAHEASEVLVIKQTNFARLIVKMGAFDTESKKKRPPLNL